jgi:hypothetical protein
MLDLYPSRPLGASAGIPKRHQGGIDMAPKGNSEAIAE